MRVFIFMFHFLLGISLIFHIYPFDDSPIFVVYMTLGMAIMMKLMIKEEEKEG